MTWYAVDAVGCDLITGASPRPPGATSPAAALTSAPVVSWPLFTVSAEGRRLRLAEALGPGGERVEELLGRLTGPREVLAAGPLEALARSTPAGSVDLPLALVDLRRAVAAANDVEGPWSAAADTAWREAREAALAAGRGPELDAALHVAMLLATELLDPGHDRPWADGGPSEHASWDAHLASGAQLWLLAGAVAGALADREADPFAAWGQLVSRRYWPVGPHGGRLVVWDGR